MQSIDKTQQVDNNIDDPLNLLSSQNVDKDTRNWPYTKGCELCCGRQLLYTGDGIMSQIKSFSSPQGTIHFQYDPLFDNL